MSVVSVIRTKIEVVSSFVIYIYDFDTRHNTWRATEPNVMYDTIMVEEKNNKNFHLHNISDVFLLSYEKSSW